MSETPNYAFIQITFVAKKKTEQNKWTKTASVDMRGAIADMNRVQRNACSVDLIAVKGISRQHKQPHAHAHQTNEK